MYYKDCKFLAALQAVVWRKGYVQKALFVWFSENTAIYLVGFYSSLVSFAGHSP